VMLHRVSSTLHSASYQQTISHAEYLHTGMLAPLAIPVSVEDVAGVALAAALGNKEVVSRDSPILSDADILSISSRLK